MSQVTPWWDSLPHKLELCRAAKQQCQHKEICHRECHYEAGADGFPRKKCNTKCELLERCAGSTEWKSVTSHDLQEIEEGPFPQQSVQPSEQLQGPADLPTPVQPQVGEQWEEFLRYALDLQRRLAQESGVPLQPEPCQQRQSVTDVPDQKQSILNRLLRREAPATGTKYNFAKLWKDYAAFCNIEEV